MNKFFASAVVLALMSSAVPALAIDRDAAPSASNPSTPTISCRYCAANGTSPTGMTAGMMIQSDDSTSTTPTILCRYCASNGTKMNGVQLNGTKMNGTKMNGTKMNGVERNDRIFNGVSANGERMNASFVVESVTLPNGVTLKTR